MQEELFGNLMALHQDYPDRVRELYLQGSAYGRVSEQLLNEVFPEGYDYLVEYLDLLNQDLDYWLGHLI